MISTYNRAQFLPELVTSLERQESAPRFEVVIVDDCSGDDTESVLKELAANASFPLTIARTERNAGPAPARNIGWRKARGEAIVFTDDDCIPDPGWLAAISASLGRADIVQGATTVDAGEAEGRGPFARVLIVDRFSWKFETCNIGYQRSVIEAAEGFDERFTYPAGEDTDLGWRALGLGARAAWAPEAVVVHRVLTTGSRVGDWVASLRDTRRRIAAPQVVSLHPRFRDHLFARWFYKPHHAVVSLALAGVARAAWPGRSRTRLLGAALVLPWLVYRSVIEPKPARLRWFWLVLPMTFVHDAADVAAVVQGSVRHRILLL